MITHILALMLMLDPTAAPQLIAPFTSKDGCMEAAITATKDDQRLHTPQARGAHLEYVCLAVIRITI